MADTDTFKFNERRESPEGFQPPKSALSFFGNGKAEWARWLLVILGSAVVSYMTASAQIDKRVSVLEERQSNQNAEVIRRLDELKADIREIRK